MPNWCSDAIVTDNPEIIERAKKVFEQGREGRLFGEFFPRPAEFDGIITGGCTIDGERVDAWREIDGTAVAVTDEEKGALLDKYGVDNWYDWNTRNYGTKWDTDVADVFPLGDGAYRIVFDTAWSPPEAFVLRLSAEFPGSPITLAYSEAGMGFWGEAVYVSGEVEIDRTIEGGMVRVGLTDEQLEDFDQDVVLTDQYREHLDKYGLNMGG